MTVEQIDARSATRSFFFVYYRVASKILYLYDKDTKKVKVRTSSPLFFLNCWASISDNRGIVASEDNKKIPRRKLATAQQRVKMCRKTQHEENSQQIIPEKFEIS